MTPVTPEDKERFMPLLASPLGGFMPLLIIFIVLIGFTLWQGKRQFKKQQEERPVRNHYPYRGQTSRG